MDIVWGWFFIVNTHGDRESMIFKKLWLNSLVYQLDRYISSQNDQTNKKGEFQKFCSACQSDSKTKDLGASIDLHIWLLLDFFSSYHCQMTDWGPCNIRQYTHWISDKFIFYSNEYLVSQKTEIEFAKDDESKIQQ